MTIGSKPEWEQYLVGAYRVNFCVRDREGKRILSAFVKGHEKQAISAKCQTESLTKWILEFDGLMSMINKSEKVKLICSFCGVKRVLPLQLISGAFAVYQLLSKKEKSNATQIKDMMYIAFTIDYYVAYKRCRKWNLCPEETIDVYLADLKKLAKLFGEGH